MKTDDRILQHAVASDVYQATQNLNDAIKAAIKKDIVDLLDLEVIEDVQEEYPVTESVVVDPIMDLPND